MAAPARIASVAVIGAGPSGLAAAKYLLAEKTFSKVRVFEQRDAVGGVWNYTPVTGPGHGDKDGDSDSDALVSPVYDQLETNIPHTLMNFSDRPFPPGVPLFPPHTTIKAYLDAYAADLPAAVLALATQVDRVRKVPAAADGTAPPHWQVDTRDRATGRAESDAFDAVVVASGHYSVPFVPAVPGLAAFRAAYPQAVVHAKYYRRPDAYADKKVIVVGRSASGSDIGDQIAAVCRQPLLVSEKAVPDGALAPDPAAAAAAAAAPDDHTAPPPPVRMLPEIRRFVVQDRTVKFADGTVETGVDAVVFCTGYLYRHPFLDDDDNNGGPPVDTADGACVRHVYEHVLYAADPTLAFVGLPMRVVPFPLAEAQAAWVARIWAGRLPVPSAATMQAWEAERVRATGGGRALHSLAYPLDVEYINRLHARSAAAERRPGLLGGDGTGKAPPFWDAETAWVREHFAQIKAASKALGARRQQVQTLADLGFDWETRQAGR